VGRYVLEPEIFDYLESQEKGVGGEIQLTDAIDRMNKDRKNLYAVNIKGDRYDCGNRKGFLEANMAAALNNESIKGDVLEIMQKLINEYKS
jgi:UTP--glucose-1-phosphate uridylyltransferase